MHVLLIVEFTWRNHLSDIFNKSTWTSFERSLLKFIAGIKKFEYKICMKSFGPQHEMSRHIKCAYDNEIPFSCTVCLKSFEYSNSWNQQKYFITRSIWNGPNLSACFMLISFTLVEWSPNFKKWILQSFLGVSAFRLLPNRRNISA